MSAPLPCRGSDHLEVLVAEVDRLASRLRTAIEAADPATLAARRQGEDAATAEATLRLDGALRATQDGGAERAGTWLDAIGQAAGGAAGGASSGSHGANTELTEADEAELGRLAALERSGVVAGLASEDLADAFGQASSDAAGLGMALVTLHGRMTQGLVAPERAGQLRRGPRVVHDASVGRVLYFPTDPAALADAWDALLRHVTGSGAGGAAARLPGPVRAALLHLELVRHQPFDAANGRVARAAGRLALLADGSLPAGLGAPDTALAEDILGYHEEVAASARRRDATAWAERILEAQGRALRHAIDGLTETGAWSATDFGTPVPSALEDAFTLGDVAAQLDLSTSGAREQCSTWVVEGRVRRIPGSAGLRMSKVPPQPPATDSAASATP
jgi:hypothetical protein